MTLIIEDGTGKPDAESYASAEDLALYAVKFGTVIPAILPHPFHRYEDDVKALAKKAGLRIIDASVTENRDNEAESLPKAKLKPEYAEAEAETNPAKMGVAELREWLAAQGVEFDPKAPKADLVKLIPAE